MIKKLKTQLFTTVKRSLKSKVAWIWIVLVVVFVGNPMTSLSQEEEKNTEGKKYLESEDPADAEACRVHLALIYDAIQEYRKTRGGFPNWLSDLVPAYVADRSVLICPFVDRTSDIKTWREGVYNEVFKDRYTSYGYEFCQEEVNYHNWRGVGITQREFKQAQVAKIGSERGPLVPLVRCFAHDPKLNLAANGEIYESGTYWEDIVAPDMHDDIEPASLFGLDRKNSDECLNFPPRDASAGAMQVDLSDFYNGALTNDWQGFPGNNLSELPIGIRTFDGVTFDVRGVVQLSGGIRLPWSFPSKVEGIPIGQPCRAIHFLHATGRSPLESMVTNIASYVVTYENGKTQRHVLHYFRDILDWWQDPTAPTGSNLVRVAWQGGNEAAKSYGKEIWLYHMKWENPWPEMPISHLDFVGHTNASAPFLVAVTLE